MMHTSLYRYLSIACFVISLFLGGFTLLAYLGAPIHQLVFLRPDEVQSYNATCGEDGSVLTLLCRGTAVFFPWLLAFAQMASPFSTYIVISVLALAAFLGYAGYRTGVFERVIAVRPVVLLLAFLLAVWLLGTTFAMGSLYNLRTPDAQRVGDSRGSSMILPPTRRIYEPTSAVYSGMSPQSLSALQANYKNLLAEGCLSPLRNAQGDALTTRTGSAVSVLSMVCVQKSLVARAFSQIALLLLFLCNLLVAGRALLRFILRLSPLPIVLDIAVSIALGALLWTGVLWSLAMLGTLYSWLLWTLFLGTPLALFPVTRTLVHDVWHRRIHVRLAWNSVPLFIGWLLLTYLALNFLNVVRPFPIGWDDLGSYLNRPRLLSSYGSFIPSMSQFQWEYLTSLGFLLFGYDSTIASTFAMQINWSAGLLAVFAAFLVGRIALGPSAGLLSALVYYTLPMTGHFSFADMKIDNASFFTAAVSVAAVLWAVFPVLGREEGHTPSSKERMRTLLVAGLILGYCFAIKATGILSIFFAVSLLAGAVLGWRGFIGATLGGFGLLAAFGPLSMREISTRLGMQTFLSQHGFIVLMLILSFVSFALAVWHHRAGLRKLLRDLLPFACGIFIAIAPWGIANMAMNGSLSLGAALKAPDTTAAQVSYYEVKDAALAGFAPEAPARFLPHELALNPKHPECLTSAKVEELDRYWGYGTGIAHYLLLPWRQVMNIDAYGYYVTLVPALLLVPLVLLLPFFWRKEHVWLRYVTAATFVFVVQWIFVGNGIIWYGLGMFIGLCFLLECLVRHAPDRASRWLFSVLLLASILIALTNRLWQFDTQKNTFEYSLGKVSADALREVTIPQYTQIRDSVVARHEAFIDTHPYTYRMGTFISYFIPKNREILPLADHQLQFFNCLNQERNHALTLRRLLALGFNSIIFDTNTQTIEKDPQGPLHRKVEAFVAFVNDPTLALDIVVNDPSNGIAYILLPVPSVPADTPAS